MSKIPKAIFFLFVKTNLTDEKHSPQSPDRELEGSSQTLSSRTLSSPQKLFVTLSPSQTHTLSIFVFNLHQPTNPNQSSAMQAALAAMVAQTIIFAPPPSHTLFSPLSNPSPPLHSSFHGFSLKLPRQSQSLTLAAAPKPLAIVAATKKAVAVLKGTSNVEGVVTLTQDDSGKFYYITTRH